MSNVPDDWNCYWTRCTRCGRRYHESEGGCDCPALCESCGKPIEECEEPSLTGLCVACSVEA